MSMFGGIDGGFAGLNRFMQNGMDPRFPRPPRAYDEYFKAYSMAMLPGKERLNVSYGGKIIMPPSALAHLTNLDIESPWFFQLRSTGSAAEVRRTHAGVLEFIADEGNVHLPAWMMRTLGLSEGDPIRLTGTTLPKGKMVKIQPQTVDFLEISDPKAVLEQAFRNFSALSPGDIVEISYNCLTFEILIMEITPNADGISIIETDLEVDFAPPKGYVEPTPQPRPPPPTMASKLNIDSSRTDSIPPTRTSTPGSMAAGSAAASGTATPAGPFRGSGQTLSGKKSKGKKERQIEQLDPFSMVRRTDMPRIVTNDTQLSEKKIPAALNLPFGKLFFGYEVIPVGGKQSDEAKQKSTEIFGGSGATLSGRAPKPKPQEPHKTKAETQTLGGGRLLAESSRSSRYATPSSSDGRSINDSNRDVIEIDSD
ncbi:related to UFD1 - ubiquitin fusion degradation protein [Melanopsichium pennsylvanicum]|uniref:Related to UFD1 - ubiquitin fusion degradation protein n=2 Tax=Melanopsichium pennsylvanicum TaxID=63383 RepID=A0AAJ4XM40_9BASI|nr:related to UFD1-ubiquitin fusion degradation protein [Melanopsichium pennsylvanicum 4]SNX84281.1 related to UFD1 - ubiquitin fusion degradation protein [Melanopsichium pennsylvanicum]